MSILDTLLRWVDVNEYRKKQTDRREARKKRPPGVPDDDDIALPPSRPEGAVRPLVCRVCGYTGGPAHRFCPRCLAETMERRR
ncbi:MAG TPA: hypothetical protein VGL86_02105 [Polyangia bacterium]|jgi:rubrerythrin